MPPHFSHLLQPLNISCFGLLKQAYGRQIEHLMRMHINHVSKLEFLCGFREAFFASITEKNIHIACTCSSQLYPSLYSSMLSSLSLRLVVSCWRRWNAYLRSSRSRRQTGHLRRSWRRRRSGSVLMSRAGLFTRRTVVEDQSQWMAALKRRGVHEEQSSV